MRKYILREKDQTEVDLACLRWYSNTIDKDTTRDAMPCNTIPRNAMQDHTMQRDVRRAKDFFSFAKRCQWKGLRCFMIGAQRKEAAKRRTHRFVYFNLSR